MEFCKNCGAMLLPNTEVCGNCGEKVTSEEIDKIKEEYKQELNDTELNSKEAVVDKGEEINTLPTIKITCPECGYNTAGKDSPGRQNKYALFLHLHLLIIFSFLLE